MKTLRKQWKINVLIIDGPNGNGRNLSYLFIKDRVNPGSIIFIDDYDAKDGDFDYDFVPNLKNTINVEEIFKFDGTGGFEKGGKFAIFKVI